MSQRPKPVCQQARTWLKGRNGRGTFASFTFQTSEAFSAYLHLVELWVSDRSEHAVNALRHVVLALPRSEWHLAAEAIASLGDWGHIGELWERICPPGGPHFRACFTGGTVAVIGRPL